MGKNLELINAILANANPTIAAALAAFNLVKEIFRREQAGDPMTFQEQVQFLIDNGMTLQDVSASWLEANGFNPDGTPKQ